MERRGRGRVRAIMRGYRRLKMEGQLGRIADVREALTNTRLDPVDARRSRLLFGAAAPSAELAVRQYLLTRVAWSTLNKALLFSLGRPGAAVVHPLPAEWRAVVEQHGFRVKRIPSALVWQAYIVLLWGYGVVTICRRVLECLKVMSRPSDRRHNGRYAYFDRIAGGHLPQPGADGRSHDVVTWYAQWPGRVRELDTLCHDVRGAAHTEINGLPVVAMSSSIPALLSPGLFLRYIGWSVAATAIAAIDILRGRWWHAAMLREASTAALTRLQDSHRLARDYLFHNSSWIFRPLWTYEAERKGSRITFYFYSTNCETFKGPQGYPTQANSWQTMNWPLYLVWDEYQAAFVRRAVGDAANIEIVGEIWFNTSAKDLPSIPGPSVAVFDVQPWRTSGYQALALAQEYYTPATANRFLQDILDATAQGGGAMVLKRKRDIGSWAHPRYRALVQQLAHSTHFLAVDSDVTAIRVIERCKVVVSMPFTSTALLGRALGKPSIYYDPQGVVQKDDRAAHGIPIVTGADELNAWMAAHLGRSTTVGEQPVA